MMQDDDLSFRCPIFGKDRCLIESVDGWFQHAPPQEGIRHWQDGRSAKECAKAWFRSGVCVMPAELQSLFDTAMGLRVTSLIKGFAEHVTRLDDYRGEHRNHDVLLIGKHGGGPVILGIEAKADEPFDDTIEDKLRKCTNPRSKQPHRVNDLLHALFGRSYNEHPELMLLRYQLLTATAGTLIEAREHVASSAILVVHVFISDKTAPENLQRNDHDLTIFVRTLAKDDSLEVESGRLYGPFHVAGSENVPTLIPLWIGKAVYNCEGPSHCGAAM